VLGAELLTGGLAEKETEERWAQEPGWTKRKRDMYHMRLEWAQNMNFVGLGP